MGMGMGMATGRVPYTTPFDDWHLYRRRREEVHPRAVARIDVTTPMGKPLHSEHVKRDGDTHCNELRTRGQVYDEARETWGRGNYFIFYNTLGKEESYHEPRH